MEIQSRRPPLWKRVLDGMITAYENGPGYPRCPIFAGVKAFPWANLPFTLATSGWYMSGFPADCLPTINGFFDTHFSGTEFIYDEDGFVNWSQDMKLKMERSIKEGKLKLLLRPRGRKVIFEMLKPDGTLEDTCLGLPEAWLKLYPVERDDLPLDALPRLPQGLPDIENHPTPSMPSFRFEFPTSAFEAHSEAGSHLTGSKASSRLSSDTSISGVETRHRGQDRDTGAQSGLGQKRKAESTARSEMKRRKLGSSPSGQSPAVGISSSEASETTTTLALPRLNVPLIPLHRPGAQQYLPFGPYNTPLKSDAAHPTAIRLPRLPSGITKPVADSSRVNNIGNSLESVNSYLEPVAAAIIAIANSCDKMQTNKHQLSYLVKRSTHIRKTALTYYLTEVGWEARHSQAVIDLLGALNSVKEAVERLSRECRLMHFIQRQGIANHLQEAHQALKTFVNLFLGITGCSLCDFSAQDQIEAERQDNITLLDALKEAQRSGVGILSILGIEESQTLDAIRGLKNNLRDYRRCQLERQFAELAIDLLEKYRIDDTAMTMYEWAISKLEIQVDGVSIGEGAFGHVFVGLWHEKKVAVKRILNSPPKTVVQKEIELWQSLRHPHIAEFYKACIDSQPPCLVAQLCSFGNVSMYLAKHPDADRTKICEQIILGMQFLHSRNIVHADLKPANVLIDDIHNVRICDFGLSRIKDFQSTQTLIGAPVVPTKKVDGTRVFMAPERLRRGSLTHATDVYAWAMTAYEIYSDESPWRSLPAEQLFRVVVEDADRPDRPFGPQVVAYGLTDDIWGIIEQAWAQDPKKRPTFSDLLTSFMTLPPSCAFRSPSALNQPPQMSAQHGGMVTNGSTEPFEDEYPMLSISSSAMMVPHHHKPASAPPFFSSPVSPVSPPDSSRSPSPPPFPPTGPLVPPPFSYLLDLTTPGPPQPLISM